MHARIYGCVRTLVCADGYIHLLTDISMNTQLKTFRNLRHAMDA